MDGRKLFNYLMISLPTSSIVIGEMSEACLRFIVLNVVDGVFDVFFTAEQRNDLYTYLSSRFFLTNRRRVNPLKPLICVGVDNGDLNFKVLCHESSSALVCVVSV